MSETTATTTPQSPADDRSEADRATFAAASHVRPGVVLKPINQVYPRAKRQVLANRGH